MTDIEGQVRYRETGLHYNLFRYYDPTAEGLRSRTR
jgi:uncharacterized protein RhaS with RHS repeats